MNKHEHAIENFPDSKAPDSSLLYLLCCSQVPRFLIFQEKSTIRSTQELYTEKPRKYHWGNMSWIILQLDILYSGSPAPYTTTLLGYSKRRSSSFSSAKRLAGSCSPPAALRSSRSFSDFSFNTFFFSWIFFNLWREMWFICETNMFS